MDFQKLNDPGYHGVLSDGMGCIDCYVCTKHRPLECKSCTTSAILLTAAQNRCTELEEIILKLKACYLWDRKEYQSNPTLVYAAEDALIEFERGRTK